MCRRPLQLAAVAALVVILVAGSITNGASADRRVVIDDPALSEASGLVASLQNPGIFWSLNDSGNAPVLFAFGSDGHPVAHLTIPGAANTDWEDLGLGPDADGRPDHALYVGDIGDNAHDRPSIQIYRVEEPRLDARGGEGPVETAADGVQRFDLSYPDGPHDAEAMLVDPRDGSVTIVAKQESRPAPVFTVSLQRADSTVLASVGAVDLPGAGGVNALITGGAVAPDRSAIALRTYTRLFVTWPVRAGESFVDALQGEPERVAMPILRQAEAVCWSADGTTMLETAEGSGPPLVTVPAPSF